VEGSSCDLIYNTLLLLCLKGLRKAAKNRSQDMFSHLDLNLRPQEYEAVILSQHTV
jgi:hypothetical protein